MVSRLAWFSLLLLTALGVLADAHSRQPPGVFGFRATVEGEQFEARFKDFAVRPRLDVKRLPTGFVVQVGLRDIDSGNADLDDEMATADWFDVVAYPVARFQADEVVVTPQGGFAANGELTIKGVQRSIAVPFSWQLTPREIRMRGELTLDRRLFGVGPQDDSSVGAWVSVFFDLVWDVDEI